MVATTPNKKLDMLRFQLISWTLIKFPESARERSFADFSLFATLIQIQVSRRWKKGDKYRRCYEAFDSLFSHTQCLCLRQRTTHWYAPWQLRWQWKTSHLSRCISYHKWQVSIAMLVFGGVIFLIFQVMILWWIWLAQPMGLWFDLIRSTPWKTIWKARWKQRHGHS